MYWLPNWTCGALHCFRWPLACALQQPQCCVPPLSSERVSHCLLQMHWGAAAAMKQVHAFPCNDFIFLLGHESLAPKAWFCPQAPCCVARLSGGLSDSNRDLGLQPCKRLLLLWERMVKWLHWVHSATNDPLLKPILFCRVECVWTRSWKDFLFSGWLWKRCGREAFFQAGLLQCIKSGCRSQADQPWDLCSHCQCKDQLVPVIQGALRRRPVHYKVVWTCRAISCLSPKNYQRVMTLSLVCSWDGCEAMTQMCKTPSHN